LETLIIVSVLQNTKDAFRDQYDYVVVTMKALPDIYDVAEIIRPGRLVGFGPPCNVLVLTQIYPAIRNESTAIVLIQNGLDIEPPIAKAFPSNPLISSVAYIAASQESAGNIVMSQDENLVLSQYQPNSTGDKKLSNFLEFLAAGNVSAKHVPNIQRIRWEKLIW
jgi:2-dehydropantoate 2-reductase